MSYPLTPPEISHLLNEIIELRKQNAELLDVLSSIQYSVNSARVVGNDWRRELSLIENLVDMAITKATKGTS